MPVAVEINPAEDAGWISETGCRSGSLRRVDVVPMEDDQLDPIRKRFGILFQNGALFNSMTVGENVALPLVEHTNLDPKIINIIVKMKLELVGLRGFEDLKPAQISGGMKKRVGLARDCWTRISYFMTNPPPDWTPSIGGH